MANRCYVLILCGVCVQIKMPFPAGQLAYDYKLDDGGISYTSSEDTEEEDDKKTFKVRIIFQRITTDCMYIRR